MKNPGIGKSFTLSGVLLVALDVYIALVAMRTLSVGLIAILSLPTMFYILSIVRTFVFCDRSHKSINITFAATIVVFFPTLLFVVISLAGLLFGVFWPSATLIFNRIGLAAVILWEAIALYGLLVGWKKIVVEEAVVDFDDLPEAFDGYKIAHLSDFHIGTYASVPAVVDKIIGLTNSAKPDIIAFTGDLVNTSATEIEPYLDRLASLRAPDGVVSVLGNHDYGLYHQHKGGMNPGEQLRRIISLEHQAGWELLNNQSRLISRGDSQIAIVGVENIGGKDFPDHSDLPHALAEAGNISFKILLSHDPSHWRKAIVGKTDIQLTLSGHTHGMQFRIGRFTPSRLGYKEWGGVYRLGKHTLVVSTGIGGNVSFRFGVYPQILILTLRRVGSLLSSHKCSHNETKPKTWPLSRCVSACTKK